MAVIQKDGALDLSINVYARLAGDTGALSAEASAEIEAVIEDQIAELAEYIVDNWPVDTGRSAQAWNIDWRPPMWVIQNPVEYAEFVHPAGQGATPIESWTGVEAESERLMSNALGALNDIVQRDNVRSLDIEIQRQQNLALRLARQANRAVRSSLFAATVQAFRDVPSRLREREANERRRQRLRGR